MTEDNYNHIDLGYLYEIADNEMDFVKEMINDYIAKIPIQFDELCAAAEAADFEKTRFISHKLKSSFQFMGAEQLITLAYAIEKLSEAKEESSINEKLGQMKGQVQSVIEELHHKLNTLAQS